MKFGLIPVVGAEQPVVPEIIHSISTELELYFEPKNYSENLAEVVVGVINVHPSGNHFFKEKRPRYIFYKTIKSKLTIAKEIVFDRLFECEITLDYLKLEKEDVFSKQVTILDSLEAVPEKMKRVKIENFDRDEFQKDYLSFIRSLKKKQLSLS